MKTFALFVALGLAGLTPVAAQTAPTAPTAAATSAPAPTALATAPAGVIKDPTPGASAVAPANGAAATPGAAGGFEHAIPTPGIGMPDGRIGTQDQFTPIGREAAAFHNSWLLILCAAISLFVLGLMLVAMVKFRRSANPVPSRTSHNTMIEVIWTLAPVLILVAIAIPSIRLIRHVYSPPPADLTVKVIGNQWFWTYQYPDNGGFEIVSNMLKEKGDPGMAAGARARTDADGPRQLAVDERMVIPAGKVVKFIVTSNDVIHSFAMPAFWIKMDANPGLINETWAKVDRPGVYFGQCSELCGARHSQMPIAIEVVTPERYAQWIASKGGTMPGAKPAAAPDSTASSTVSAIGVTPAAAPAASAAGAAGAAAPAKAGAAPLAATPGAANRAVDNTK